jgi:hypothetical protein
MNTGIDGGMNKVFASKLPEGSTGLSEGGEGQGLQLIALSRAPGTIPSTVNPPRGPVTSPSESLAASMAPAQPPAPETRVASATPTSQSDGFFSNLARKVGFGASADTTATAKPVPAAKPRVVEAKRNEAPARAEVSTPRASKPEASKEAVSRPEPSKPEIRQAVARPPLKPALSEITAASASAAKDGLVAGAQPIVQANSFESRFSAFK